MQQRIQDNQKNKDMKDQPNTHSRHGGAYDRGAADAYYRRPFAPHFYKAASYQSIKFNQKDMTPLQVQSYTDGYNYQKASGVFDSNENWTSQTAGR